MVRALPEGKAFPPRTPTRRFLAFTPHAGLLRPACSRTRQTPWSVFQDGPLGAAVPASLTALVLAFLKKEDSALYADVSEVHVSGPEDLRVTFLDGTTARFGSDVGEAELKHMASVLSDLAAKGAPRPSWISDSRTRSW